MLGANTAKLGHAQGAATSVTMYRAPAAPARLERHSTVLHCRNRRVLLLPKVPEQRVPRPDGSVFVYPAHSSGELSRLTVAAFGGGFERALNRYASFRLEGSGFAVIHSEGYLGFRVLAGISVPIRGYRASPIQ